MDNTTMEIKPFYKLDRTKDFNITGFAKGVNESLAAGHAGLIINAKYTQAYILVKAENITDKVRTWGDRSLFNYLVSTGELITAGEVSILNEEEVNYSLVTVEEVTRTRVKK
jgi:hypothetical protein